MLRAGFGRLLAAVVWVAGVPEARAEVHWKTRNAGQKGRLERAKSRTPERAHYVLHFDGVPGEQTREALAARGLRVVAYLPDSAVIIGATGEPRLDGLNVKGVESLQAPDKLSPEVLRSRTSPRRETRQYYVVEFHEDVPWEDRRALLAENGLDLRDHPDLVGHHMLVRGTLTQLQALTEWDEVAYVFPASGDLVLGQPLIGCLGASAPAGMVGQLTEKVGDGWDGPGLARVDLTYTVQQMTAKLPALQVEQALVAAMAEWSRHIRVRFQKASDFNGRKNVNILFGAGDHGDGFDFDGAGRVLAHAFYPSLPNPEPIAGDLHFDDAERWQIGNEVDVFSVALHELGHSLGLGHSDVPNAVMYPYYRRATALSAEDVAAARTLYESGSEPPPPSPSPEPAQPIVAWLHSPEQNHSTNASTVLVRGAVNRTAGSVTVTWRTGTLTGAAQVTAGANGLSTWTAPSIPLSVGANLIRVEMVDNLTARTSVEVLVHRTAPAPAPAPAPGPSEPNPEPPAPAPPPTPALRFLVTSPADGGGVTGEIVRVTGTVQGGRAPYTIRWISDRGFHGTVARQDVGDGLVQWEIASLPLATGANGITLSARDADGHEALQTLRVVRSAPEPAPAPTPSPAPAPSPAPTPPSTPGHTDTVKPRVAITSPNTAFLMTRASRLTLRGTASDDTQVEQVRWACSCGEHGVASGTTSWSVANVVLPVGTSEIRVTARDRAGNESTVSMRVNRYVD